MHVGSWLFVPERGCSAFPLASGILLSGFVTGFLSVLREDGTEVGMDGCGFNSIQYYSNLDCSSHNEISFPLLTILSFPLGLGKTGRILNS